MVEEKPQWRQQIDMLLTFSVVLRWVGIGVGIGIFLGWAFFLIFTGVLSGMLRLSFCSETVYRMLAKVAGLKTKFSSYERAPFPRWYMWFFQALHLGVSLVWIAAGIWCLKVLGLCGQNPICILVNS